MDNNRNDNNKNKSGKGNSDSKTFIKILIVSLGLTFLFNLVSTTMMMRSQSELNYSEFVNWVEENKVEKVEFRSDKLVVYPYADKLGENDKKLVAGNDKFYVGKISNDELVPIIRKHNVEIYSPIQNNSPIFKFF